MASMAIAQVWKGVDTNCYKVVDEYHIGLAEQAKRRSNASPGMLAAESSAISKDRSSAGVESSTTAVARLFLVGHGVVTSDDDPRLRPIGSLPQSMEVARVARLSSNFLSQHISHALK